jgi:hypothetical protein
MLTAFIVLQLLLDIEIVLFLVSRYRQRARPKARVAAVPAEPPAWYRDFLILAEDVLAAVEPLLDALDRGQLPMPASAAAALAGASAAAEPAREALANAAPRDRHREAFALLRAGTPSEEVARREHLSPGQVRLIENLVAAEGRLAAAVRP